MMRRDLVELASRDYDVLVIGAGIYGACVARDAAQRGLRVALVDRADFGGGSSHNSLKLIHGGLRYLQHLDLRRVRQSIAERRHWLLTAPHLIRPLQFVIPAYGHGTRSPEALGVAMKVYDVLARRGNRGLSPLSRVPRGSVISRDACLSLIPGVESERLRGGAIWYDGQMLDADRVLLECVIDANRQGATVANYVSVMDLVRDDMRVTGAVVEDAIGAADFELRARLTINTCGPWAPTFIRHVLGPRYALRFPALSQGLNVVTSKVFADYAFGVRSRRMADSAVGSESRLFFFTPWKDCTVIGTSHLPYHGSPDQFRPTEHDILRFLHEINDAYPPAELTPDDITYCYYGLTPAEGGTVRGQIARAHRGAVIDHEQVDGLAGLISVIGVKYTTARLLAQWTVDLALARLGRRPVACTTHIAPLPGAPQNEERAAAPALDVEIPAAFRQRCVRAVTHEMAIRLEDVLLRRTDHAARGLLQEPDLQWCADMMAQHLGWSDERKQREIARVEASPNRRSPAIATTSSLKGKLT